MHEIHPVYLIDWVNFVQIMWIFEISNSNLNETAFKRCMRIKLSTKSLTKFYFPGLVLKTCWATRNSRPYMALVNGRILFRFILKNDETLTYALDKNISFDSFRKNSSFGYYLHKKQSLRVFLQAQYGNYRHTLMSGHKINAPFLEIYVGPPHPCPYQN